MRADADIMRYLADHLKSLRVLCKIRRSDLIALAQLTRLSSLDLHMLTTEDSLTQDELDVLSSLTGLSTLQIFTGDYCFSRYRRPPSHVTSLSSLQRMQLTRLQLHPSLDMFSRPAHLPHLQSLELRLDESNFDYDKERLFIPNTLASLRSLRHLCMRHVPLIGVPWGLSTLSQLTCLELHGVRAEGDPEGESVLPAMVSCLTSLQVLSLWQTPLSIQPCALHFLSAMTKLQLTNHQLGSTTGPLSISALPPNLAELNLRYNELQCLPADIAQMTQLTLLDLSCQKRLKQEEDQGGNLIYQNAGLQLDSSLVDIVCMPKLKIVLLGQIWPHKWSTISLRNVDAAEQAMQKAGAGCRLLLQYNESW